MNLSQRDLEVPEKKMRRITRAVHSITAPARKELEEVNINKEKATAEVTLSFYEQHQHELSK